MISLPPRSPEPRDLSFGIPKSLRELEERHRPRKVGELWIGDHHFDVLADPLMSEERWELRGGG